MFMSVQRSRGDGSMLDDVLTAKEPGTWPHRTTNWKELVTSHRMDVVFTYI